MAGFKNFVIGMGIVLFSTLLIFGFVTGFLGQTNPNSDILNGKYGLSTTQNNIQNSLSSFSSTATSIQGQFANSTPTATDYLFLIFRGAFYIPLTIFNLIITSITTLGSAIYGLSFGLPLYLRIGLNLLMASLITIGVLLGIKAIRTGESER